MYRTALLVRPEYPQAHVGLADLLLRSGRVNQALRHYRRALQLWPGSIAARRGLAAALAHQGQFAQAIEMLRAALARSTEDARTLNNLAWLLATCRLRDLRDGPEALRLAQQACRLTQYAEPSMLDTLAAAHAELAHFKEAIELARVAIDLARSNGNQELARAIQGRLPCTSSVCPTARDSGTSPPPAQIQQRRSEPQLEGRGFLLRAESHR